MIEHGLQLNAIKIVYDSSKIQTVRHHLVIRVTKIENINSLFLAFSNASDKILLNQIISRAHLHGTSSLRRPAISNLVFSWLKRPVVGENDQR